MRGLKVLLIALTLSVVVGCAGTGKIEKPTTPSNTGGAALVAYGSAGYYASKYFALNVCATPPVYPCKTMVVNNKLLEVDAAAWGAAKAADAVGASDADKKDAAAKLAALKKANGDPEVTKQLAMLPKESTP